MGQGLVARQQSVALRAVAHDDVVARMHIGDVARADAFGEGGIAGLLAGELVDDGEVRIGAVLADLVADARRLDALAQLVQRFFVVAAEPAVRPARGGDQVVGGERRARTARRRRPAAGAVGIEPARVGLTPLLVPGRQLLLIVAGRFVGGVQQHHRRVVAIGLDQPGRLVIEHVQHLVLGIEGVPHAAFRLQVEAQFVGGGEGGFGRAPGMEAHAVQAPRLADADDALPRRHIGRRIAGQRETAAIVRGAEVEQLAVQPDDVAVGPDLAHAEGDIAPVVGVAALQADRQVLERRREFGPGLRVGHRYVEGRDTAVLRPRHLGRGAAGRQNAAARLAGQVADDDADLRRLLRQVRKDLGVVDPYRRRRRQFDAADNAVPRRAFAVGDRVAVEAVGRGEHAVVDADRQPVPAGAEPAQVDIVRRDQRPVRTDRCAVDIDIGLPARAFQLQRNALAGPGGGDVDVALVPGDAQIMAHRLRQVGHLDVAGLGVILVLRQQVPAHVARQGGDELRLGGDLVAIALGLQDTGQADMGVGGEVLGEPLPGDAGVVAVQGEAPLPGQRHGARRGRFGGDRPVKQPDGGGSGAGQGQEGTAVGAGHGHGILSVMIVSTPQHTRPVALLYDNTWARGVPRPGLPAVDRGLSITG